MPNLVERPSAEVSELRTAQIFALEKAHYCEGACPHGDHGAGGGCS